MKTRLLLITLLLANVGLAQNWCVPPPFITGPYTGIDYFRFDDWVHTSSDADGYTYYSEETLPTVTPGSDHEMAVHCMHNIVGSFFSGNLSYRVWIDWNIDGDFTDEGEEVLMEHEQWYEDTHYVAFTVPDSAVVGITRMRVYNDMPVNEGHDWPVPCGYLNSTNGIGHHGEAQDYDLEIIANVVIDTTDTVPQDPPLGINHANHNGLDFTLRTEPNAVYLNLMSDVSGTANIEVYNLAGQTVATTELDLISNQLQSASLTGIETGVYLLRLRQGDRVRSVRFLNP